MKQPFSGNRQAINDCSSVNTIYLHSYQTNVLKSSAHGAALLSNAVQDITRTHRPKSFQALGLYVSCDSAAALVKALTKVNELCQLKVFVEAARAAKSLVNIEQHKMILPGDNQQSIEWHPMSDARSVMSVANAYQDVSISLIDQEGKNIVSNIESAFSELETLKTERDSRLSEAVFLPTNLPINVVNFNAESARGLASKIKRLGDNNQHWAFMFFVGNDNELKLMREMFT